MADISKIQIGADQYDIKDAIARGMIWKGTQAEYETAASTIPVGTIIFITDDGGNVIEINYVDLINKPQINGNTLAGNKTGAQLGLVDAVSGKGLSTNDYTTTEKSKLSGIEAGAEVNIIEQIKVNNVAQAVDNKSVNLTFGTAAAKNSTSSVTANSTDLVESGAVKTAIDAAMVSAYKAGGSKTCAELTSALLVAENEGYVFTMSDTGTTTADFIEGAGKEIGVGADVGVIKRDNAYKFNLLPGIIDTSNFITKSATNGLVKNDGSIDTTTYVSDISGKADKVTSATNGNFAGLDSNGNLTDSGSKASDFATSTQGGKADTAIQTIKINGTAQTKTDGTVDLPAYPTTLPASDTTSTYSATGTAPVNGTAVAAALGTLDVSEAGGSGKYIQAISESDGKISATAQDLNATAVGLGNVANTGDSATPVENGTTKFTTGGAYTELAKKVDKVDGKGLSTNDYTTEEKNKLSGIEASADVNIIEYISLNRIIKPTYDEGIITPERYYGFNLKDINFETANYGDIAKMLGLNVVSDLTDTNGLQGYLYSNGCAGLICRGVGQGDILIDGSVQSKPMYGVDLFGIYDKPEKSLITSVFIPYGVEYIYTESFTYCPNLKKVFLPSSLITIGQRAFWGTDLISINIPSGVTLIQEMAFAGCDRLNSIYLPKTLAMFELQVFTGCINLTDIYYEGTQAEWEAIEGLSGAGIPPTATVHYEYLGYGG